MGRQVNFYQLDSDIYVFLNFLKKNNLFVFDKNGCKMNKVSDLYANPLCAIGEEYYVYENSCCNTPIEYSVPEDLSSKGFKKTRFYLPNSSCFEERNIEGIKVINNGRFYLHEEFYENKKIVSVYNFLKKYIKNTCLYSKEMSAYFSPTFIEQYRLGTVFAANCNNVFPVMDI